MSERMMHIEEAMITNINVVLGDNPIGVGEGAIHTDMTAEKAQEIARLLPRYLVEVADDAPGSCIDGRGCAECLDGQDTEARYSVAGGPLVLAYAMAELTGWFGQDGTQTIDEKLGQLKDVLEVGKIRLGAHVDAEAVANKYLNAQTGGAKTGCGADDKAPQAAEISAAVSKQAADGGEVASGLFQAFMDEAYNARKLDELEGQEQIAKAFEGWDPLKTLQLVADEDPHAVENLEADETPTHGHAEAMAVAVKVPGKTIDQKALYRDTGVQVFVIDVPYIKRIAQALATGPHATEQFDVLFHAGIAYHLGTYVALCDGSQRFASIESTQEVEAA